MKKTVNYKGEKIKVDFQYKGSEVIKGSCGDVNGWEQKHLFSVNGKEYFYKSKSKETKRGTTSQIYFKGIKFPDSEKKIIEYILENEN